MSKHKAILPIIDNNELLLLWLNETNESKEYLEEIKKHYNEIMKIKYKTLNGFYSDDKSTILDNYNASEILSIKELASEVVTFPSSRQVEVPDDDNALWYLQSYHYETEYYTKEEKRKIYEVEIKKQSYLSKLMHSYVYQGFNSNNYIDLQTIVNTLTAIENKDKKLTSKELLLTENKLIQIFKSFFSTVNITDARQYFEIKTLLLGLSGETHKKRNFLSPKPRLQDNTKHHIYNISNSENVEKLLEFLISNGYIPYYKKNENGIMLLDYNDKELQLASQNTKLLNNELKPLKKTLLRK